MVISTIRHGNTIHDMYCQKCRSPLKADNYLDGLNPAAFDLLVGSSNKSQRREAVTNLNYPQERKELYNKTSQKSQSPLYKRNIPAPRTEHDRRDSHGSISQPQLANPEMSFIDITQSQMVPSEKILTADKLKTVAPKEDSSDEKASLAWQIERHERLFSILSSHSDIDHPICVECSSMLVSQLNARLASTIRERDAYASFMKSLQQNPGPIDTDSNSAKELESLLKEEDKAFRELVQLENEKKALEADLAELAEENRQLDLKEREFWESRNAFGEKLYDIQSELISLQEKYVNDQQQLERLQRTNVYNDTFCIGHDGYFGTINGLRLGRLPSQNVEWAEINAAWGQTLLLLATVADRIGFKFQGYQLRPLGSTSRIEKIEWPQQPPESTQKKTNVPPPKVTALDLFSSGDMPLGRVFNHRRFDSGMVAFLDCLSQLGKYVEKASKPASQSPRGTRGTLVLPYTIQGDKIGDVSIRLGVGFSQDENFTKACKYTLTCCKFLLAHVSNLEGSKGS